MNHPNSDASQALLSSVGQPTGKAFFLGTWTGRIILLNTIMFILTALHSQNFSLIVIDINTLLQFGAKDSVLLAQGEYWRFITPMFIHGGLIHFAFNNWALYVLGYQIERLLSDHIYLLLYVLAGVGGNIASAMFSASVSVGASGALFGLLGCGFYIERAIQSRVQELTGSSLRRGAFTSMIVMNIIIGFVIPQIDNAAHIGGLVVGISFGFIILHFRANQLKLRQPKKAIIVGCVVAILFLGAGFLGSSPRWVRYRLHSAVQRTDSLEGKIFYLTRILVLYPLEEGTHLHRLVLLLQAKNYDLALNDFLFLRQLGGYDEALKGLAKELGQNGFSDAEKWLIERLRTKVQAL